MKRALYSLALTLLLTVAAFVVPVCAQPSFYAMFPDTYVVAWDGVHYGASINDTLAWPDDSTFDSTTHYSHIPYSNGAPDSVIDTTIVIDTSIVTHDTVAVRDKYHTWLVDTVRLIGVDTAYSVPFEISTSLTVGYSATSHKLCLQAVCLPQTGADSVAVFAVLQYSGVPGALTTFTANVDSSFSTTYGGAADTPDSIKFVGWGAPTNISIPVPIACARVRVRGNTLNGSVPGALVKVIVTQGAP